MFEEEIIEGGQRRRVLFILSSSIPTVARFRAVATDGQPVAGKVEIRRGLFGERREEQPLKLDNACRKGFWDVVFSVYVTPERQSRIMFQTWHFRAHHLGLVLGAVLVLGLAGGIVTFFVAAGTPG